MDKFKGLIFNSQFCASSSKKKMIIDKLVNTIQDNKDKIKLRTIHSYIILYLSIIDSGREQK